MRSQRGQFIPAACRLPVAAGEHALITGALVGFVHLVCSAARAEGSLCVIGSL